MIINNIHSWYHLLQHYKENKYKLKLLKHKEKKRENFQQRFGTKTNRDM